MQPMELIRGLTNLGDSQRGSVVTIGTFDGIHLGHQGLIQRLKGHAARLGRPAMLLTFEPMPREYLAPADPPARLTSWRERWRILCGTGGSGLDSVCLLRFGESLRNLSGEEFANLLAQELQAPAVVVGHDFRFGRQGEATAPRLAACGERLGFTVDVVSPVTIDGERVSSSGIRAALARSDFEFARRWLGRPYSMRGRVVRGNQLGRTLGFPTANLRLERRRAPLAGIFAVRVRGDAEVGLSAGLPGVASLGTRPTVNGVETLLEAHVFDFARELYGREIEVEFVAKLRDEERFADLDALTAQMQRDAEQARGILQCQ
jgi:riboflavin kinase / FMN adenylyltransferase